MNITQQTFDALLQRNPALQRANAPKAAAPVKSKWKNKPCWASDGALYRKDDPANSDRKARGDWVFASQGERGRWQELAFLESHRKIDKLRLQVPFELIPTIRWQDSTLSVVKYVADFVYEEGGRVVVEDFKGRQTPEFRLKLRLFLQRYGDTHEFRISSKKKKSTLRRKVKI